MNEQQNQNNPNQNSKKKISFISAIFVVMGSSIGAGIFFKSGTVLENAQSSLIMALFCWIIAAFSVIALAFALIEVASARNDNLSFLGWTKTFNSRMTFNASKNFMFYIYMPLTYFFMPLYVIQSLQDGLGALINNDSSPITMGTNVDWLIWTIVSIFISCYFIIVSGYSSKVGNIQNNIITYIKFIPLAVVTLIGFILVGMNAGGWNDVNISLVKPTETISSGASIAKFAPGIGMFLAISAIFFAYDGFYVSAGLQSEMKEPKKTPFAILIGLIITTVIYLLVAISMTINGGSFPRMEKFMTSQWGQAGKIIYGLINLMIAIGILGIINGFSMWGPRFIEDLIKEGELPFSIKYVSKLNSNKPKIGIMYLLVTCVPVIIIFTLIGSLGYIDQSNYGTVYGSGMANLYSFADLTSTWTTLFIFAFITASIYGCYKNRKTKLIKVDQKKYFKPMAIISILVVSVALLTTIIIPIIDLATIPQIDQKLCQDSYSEIIVSRIMLIVTLIIFIATSYLPSIIEEYINIKKYGSLEKYQEWKNKNFNQLN